MNQCISFAMIFLLVLLTMFLVGCKDTPTHLHLTISEDAPAKPAAALSCKSAGVDMAYEIETIEFAEDRVRWEITPVGYKTVVVQLSLVEKRWGFDRQSLILPRDTVLRSFTRNKILIEFERR